MPLYYEVIFNYSLDTVIVKKGNTIGRITAAAGSKGLLILFFYGNNYHITLFTAIGYYSLT